MTFHAMSSGAKIIVASTASRYCAAMIRKSHVGLMMLSYAQRSPADSASHAALIPLKAGIRALFHSHSPAAAKASITGLMTEFHANDAASLIPFHAAVTTARNVSLLFHASTSAAPSATSAMTTSVIGFAV